MCASLASVRRVFKFASLGTEWVGIGCLESQGGCVLGNEWVGRGGVVARVIRLGLGGEPALEFVPAGQGVHEVAPGGGTEFNGFVTETSFKL